MIQKAFTSMCKKEMCTLRDALSNLEALDAQVVGVSVNDPFSNKAFHEMNILNFPLLCDYNKEVVKKYDAFHEDFAGLKGYTAARARRARSKLQQLLTRARASSPTTPRSKQN